MLDRIRVRGIGGVFFFLFFSSFIPWHSFADPDGFYHAHISWLMWQQGLIRSFPWLDLTTLGKSFADQHWLFHVIESPFVHLFGEMVGARVTAILLASLFIFVSYRCLCWLGIRYAKWWSLFLMLSAPLLFRLLLMKATPLALTWFVLGMTATWKRKPMFVALIACLFALSHGGWVFLLGSIGLIALGDVLFRIVVDEERVWDAVRLSLWRECLASFFGVCIGLLLHPHAVQMVNVLWIQIVKIGLGTPYEHVVLGGEWEPLSVIGVITHTGSWLIPLLAGGYGLLSARRRVLDRNVARAITAFALPVFACLIMTFKSQRNLEYLIPAFFLWIPWIWMFIEPQKLFSTVISGSRKKKMGIIFLLLIIFFGPIIRGLIGTWQSLHRPLFLNTTYRDAFIPVRERAHEGDRVFHSDWDEFPVLFQLDDRLRYVAGLDPTFLYEASSTLSDAYRDVTWGQTITTPQAVWEFVHDRIQARFVFISKRKNHEQLLKIIKNDSRYQVLRDAPDAVTFEVVGN